MDSINTFSMQKHLYVPIFVGIGRIAIFYINFGPYCTFLASYGTMDSIKTFPMKKHVYLPIFMVIGQPVSEFSADRHTHTPTFIFIYID